MIGIYVLVSIFCQFSPEALFSFVSPQVQEANIANVELVVSRLNGVRLGSPVLLDGAIVGSIADIRTTLSKRKGSDQKQYNMVLSLEDSTTELRSGAIGVITAPVSKVNTEAESVVELINPQDNTLEPILPGAKLQGFSSLSEFWSSPSVSGIL